MTFYLSSFFFMSIHLEHEHEHLDGKLSHSRRSTAAFDSMSHPVHHENNVFILEVVSSKKVHEFNLPPSQTTLTRSNQQTTQIELSGLCLTSLAFIFPETFVTIFPGVSYSLCSVRSLLRVLSAARHTQCGQRAAPLEQAEVK